MMEWLKKWWDGEYVPYENTPNDGVFIVGGYQKRHWTSKTTHRIWDFLKVEWKWVIGISIPIAGLVMTYIRFF